MGSQSTIADAVPTTTTTTMNRRWTVTMEHDGHRHFVHVSASDAIEAGRKATKHHPEFTIEKIEKRRK